MKRQWSFRPRERAAEDASSQRASTRPSSATMLVFPVAQRLDFVERIAAQMVARSATGGEQHLQLQLRRQGTVLRRKGIAEPIIKRELASLESAVRQAI